jgi:hypothetical protein
MESFTDPIALPGSENIEQKGCRDKTRRQVFLSRENLLIIMKTAENFTPHESPNRKCAYGEDSTI